MRRSYAPIGTASTSHGCQATTGSSTFTGMGEQDASLFEAPFEHLKALVRPERQKAREAEARDAWWRLVEPTP